MSFSVVDYEPRFANAFRLLNEEWIAANFSLETHDSLLLGDPEGRILRPGGAILVALDDGRPVGVCALVKDREGYELSKFAVSPAYRGRGIGQLLGEAAISRARLLGAKVLHLEGNTKMAASIRLYRRLGFAEVEGKSSVYRRCNITMELPL